MKSSTQKYYLVSDLHMGGDGALQHCDYTAEFIEFLKELEKEGPDTELLIVGDTFGFWELTLVQGVEKLDHIVTAIMIAGQWFLRKSAADMLPSSPYASLGPKNWTVLVTKKSAYGSSFPDQPWRTDALQQ